MRNSVSQIAENDDLTHNNKPHTQLIAEAKLGPGASAAAPLTRRELLKIQQSAKEAIEAMNCRHKSFIDEVANPLRIVALVDMALQQVQE